MMYSTLESCVDCYTDHRLVRSKVAFTFKPPPRKKGPQTRRLNVQKLRCPLHQKTYQAKLAERLDRVADPDTDIDQHWMQLKTVLQETTAEVAGFSSRKHKDWFDESDTEIQELLKMKRSGHQHLLTNPDNNSLKAAYRTACNTLQKRIRKMKNDWWTDLSKKMQMYADLGDTRLFFEALKAVHGPSHQIQAPLCSADGYTLLTDKDAIMHCWSKHFSSLFSDKPELDDLPTLEEVKKAICQMNPRKSPGIDGIPAEVYQYGGEKETVCLHDLFTKCWEQGLVPQDLRDAIIVSLYKNKGVKSDCSNYRGITLLSIAGKVLACLMLNRLIPTIAEENAPESQCGFRANRGTTGVVFVLRQIQEKCREQNMGLFVAFVDLTEDFDTVSREGLWKILARLGCPPKFLTILRHRPDRGL